MWEKVLREPHGLVSIYEKKGCNFMKLNKKGLGLLGKNKLNKETDWIGYKENEGYKFKSLKKQLWVKSSVFFLCFHILSQLFTFFSLYVNEWSFSTKQTFDCCIVAPNPFKSISSWPYLQPHISRKILSLYSQPYNYNSMIKSEKDQGNQLFKKGKYSDAIKHYITYV